VILTLIIRRPTPFSIIQPGIPGTTERILRMTRILSLFGFASISLSCALAETPATIPPIRGLSRTHLLEYRASDGTTKTATTPAEWQSRRADALKAFQQIAGPLPGKEKRCALDVTIDEETDCGSYVRRAITYASEPGSRTTAYLCIPKTALAGRMTSGVLCLHPTENNIGYKVVVGLGGKPNRQYASELAERGFVTIAPSYPLLAQYQPDLKALGYQSGTMKAIWDNIRALDVLESLPFVKKGRFATIGHSLGGHNSIFTALFDDRIQCVVSSCGFDSVLDYKDGNIKGWVQERYMMKMEQFLGRPQNVPFDYYELIACLAPRTLFVNAPLRDSNFKHDSVDRIAKAASAIYALHGVEKNIRVEHPDSEHDFPDEQRFAAYDVIAKTLNAP
jgi:Prolyl oligopeptidase family